MRIPTNDNYSYVTVEFAYSAGTGYARAYTGRKEERLWMDKVFPGCKSRDEAELMSLLCLIEGDETYSGFTRNAHVQLFGFDSFEKGIYNKHRVNKDMWSKVLNYFGRGRNGYRFDLIRINNKFSSVIAKAETFAWAADNRKDHADKFSKYVSDKITEAKAARAAVARAYTPVAAKSKSSLSSKVETAMKASTKEAA